MPRSQSARAGRSSGFCVTTLFTGHPERPDIVRFVSVLSRLPRSTPRLPIILPSSGSWLLKVLARDGRFVFGLYRRHMKVISYLGTLDRLFRGTGHDAQLEYHHRDRERAE